MSLVRSIGGRLLLLALALSGLLGVLWPITASATTAASTTRYSYDAPQVTRVGVAPVRAVASASSLFSDLREESASPHTEAGTSTTPVVFVVATNTVDDLVGAFCSFSGGTRVLMADGTTKPISQVRVGDFVYATDPETGESGAREVIGTLPHTDQLLTLRTSSGEIVTTEDHKYWNATDGAWQESQHLDEGDRLLTNDGDIVTVVGFDWTTLHTATAYDLEVADVHTFYVGTGDENVLVHNCSIRELLRNADLPGGSGSTGPFRFRAPEGLHVGNGLPRSGNGFVDRFGNVWQKGPAHGRAAAEGQAFEWDVQLSQAGRNAWGNSAHTGVGGQQYVNVTPDGFLSH